MRIQTKVIWKPYSKKGHNEFKIIKTNVSFKILVVRYQIQYIWLNLNDTVTKFR